MPAKKLFRIWLRITVDIWGYQASILYSMSRCSHRTIIVFTLIVHSWLWNLTMEHNYAKPISSNIQLFYCLTGFFNLSFVLKTTFNMQVYCFHIFCWSFDLSCTELFKKRQAATCRFSKEFCAIQSSGPTIGNGGNALCCFQKSMAHSTGKQLRYY